MVRVPIKLRQNSKDDLASVVDHIITAPPHIRQENGFNTLSSPIYQSANTYFSLRPCRLVGG